jgi:hypothetical protein
LLANARKQTNKENHTRMVYEVQRLTFGTWVTVATFFSRAAANAALAALAARSSNEDYRIKRVQA